MPYKIEIEYNGKKYHGWQKQNNLPTIQETIEDSIFSLSGEVVTLYGSGRTDAGVHALNQCAHFNMEKDISPFTIKEGLNFFLQNKYICITSCIRIDDTHAKFHARFSAKKKQYLYRIFNRRELSPFEMGISWHIQRNIDIKKLNNDANKLIGNHDFTAFMSTSSQSLVTNRTIDDISIENSNNIISLRFVAKSFLHNQIRIMVGTLIQINLFENKNSIEMILALRERKNAGITAPAHGLFLEKIYF